MKTGSGSPHKLIAVISAFALGNLAAPAQQYETFAERPSLRQEMAQQAQSRFVQNKEEALQWAATRGVAARIDEGERVIELMAIENGRPIFYITHNTQAAISTAADMVRNVAPYNLNGADLQVGVWDGGAILTSHQEFGSRVTVQDGTVSTHYHATHVGGTIGAAGVVPSAMGMAPSALIDSYDWNSDISEMTAAAASYAGEPGKIMLSNHSYGLGLGWGGSYWYGSGWSAGSEEELFGQYSSYTRDWDQIVYSAPYYLPFKSAGNDRNDNPSEGQTVYYDVGSGWVSATYNSSLHPKGDGVYKSGYDTVGTQGCAKNIMTVGAVNDAVSSSVRSVDNGTMSTFSSWGPADDGRIKPDIVANGTSLYSTFDTSSTSYSSLSGTSMSSPNACGSAALLAEYYMELFPGAALRASTLKGLIIHTADDDPGNPGPDYSFGWGLMNTRAAADLLRDYAAGNTSRLTEAQLTPANSSDTYVVTVTGVEPLRATLCWSDPPGTAQTLHDSRTAALVNDLDLKITGAAGTFYPYKLDYNNPSAPATTNSENNVDNVEQVYIAFPDAGDYTITVDYDGTLTNGEQWYSLLISPNSGGIVPPLFFTASAVSTSQIDLAWSKNVSNDNVVVAFSTTEVFSNPTNGTTYGVGSSIGSATVIYSGAATNFQHMNLSPSTHYYYQAWSVNSSIEYSSGAAAAAATFTLPSTLPFFEPFATMTFSDSAWALVEDAGIDTLGIGEPSEPYSARLNGDPDGEDIIQTVPFDLSGETSVELSYWYEQTGGGESADSGDDLIVEYLSSGYDWVELDRQLGFGADMSSYVQSAVMLPADALHGQARIRFLSSCTAGPFDDWFVDDIRLEVPSLRITTATLPTAMVMSAYAATLEAEHGAAPYTWSIDSGNLQAGLTFAAGGVISGTPAESGINQITFAVEDSNGVITNRTLDLVVLPQTVDHLTWDIIDSPQFLDQPFEVTVTARDVNTNVVVDFSGSVHLNGWMPESAVSNVTIGAGTATWNYPMSTFYHDSRTQVIYLQSELESSCTITSLSLNVASVPGQTMNMWTIRMRHTPLNEYSSSAVWESADWVTVHSGNAPAAATGWREFIFSVPFEYNGSDNLMIDFSHNNTSYTSDGQCYSTSMSPAYRSVYYRTDSGYGDPLGWPTNGFNPGRNLSYNIPNIRLGVITGSPIPIAPTNSSLFVDGIWTGSVTVLETNVGVLLEAVDSEGHSGSSNPFDVLEASHYYYVNYLSTYGISEGQPDSDLVEGMDPLLPNPGDQALVQLIQVGENGIIDAPPGLGGSVLGDDVLLYSDIYEYDGSNYFWDAWAIGSYGTVTVPFEGNGQVYGRIFDSAEVPDESWYYQGHIQVISAAPWETLTNSTPQTYDLGQGVLNFASNQIAVNWLNVSDASVSEGNSGEAAFVIEVSLTFPSDLDIRVDFATEDVTAIAGSDYVATSGSLVFAPGETTQTVIVLVNGDLEIEPDELFNVNLSGAVNASIADAQGVGTIANDDGLPGQVYFFEWQPIAAPQYVDQPFEVTVIAKDAMSNTVTAFAGPAEFSAMADGNPLPQSITPTNSSLFVDGIWTGSVTVLETNVGVLLEAVDSEGHSGSSNPFDVLEASHYYYVNYLSTYGISEGQPDSDLVEGMDPLLPNPGDQALVQLIQVGENGIIDAPPGLGGSVLGDDVLLYSYIYEYDGSNYFWDAWAIGPYGTVTVPFEGNGQVYGRIFDSANPDIYSWYYQGHIQEISAVPWESLTNSTPQTYDLGQGVLNFATNWIIENPDLDGDTIPDWWETAHFGSITNCNPLEDYDYDGVLNWQEYIADTIPTDSNSVLRLIGILPGSNGVDVAWQGGVNAWQFLESNRGLTTTGEQWIVIFTNSPPTAISNNYHYFMGTNSVLFYRIRAER